MITLLLSASLFFYQAEIVSVYDADTVTARVDLGFHVTIEEKLRLYRIDAPEMRGRERREGIRCRDMLRGWVLGKDVMIQTVKDKKGKYGRYLAELWVGDENLNNKLVDEGCAEFRNY